jgi:glyoxylase I family protein
MPIDVRGMAPLLEVFDMAASLAFYRDVLGFEVVSTSGEPDPDHWALLRLNGVELMLDSAYEPGERPAAPDPARVAGHHDAALYFGCPDVDAAYAHLRALGIAAKEPHVASYGMKQLYVTDPDGYVVCFQWPESRETADRWHAWYGVEAGQA